MSDASGPPALTVFIADDSPPVAEMLVGLLASPGRVEVVGVGGSEEDAISSIRRMRPDVVVLDLQLGEGSGTNVIRAVRAEPALAATRLLVTSNHDSPQLRAGCLGLGADGYYDKVKELSGLADAMAALAEAKRRGRS
jgi:DNA-binding NarL/FixJ family response regulator